MLILGIVGVDLGPLVHALLEDIFRQLMHRWSTRKYGVGHTLISTLTNPRFADGVILFATTLPQVAAMLNSLHEVAGTCGLQPYPEKTVILSILSQRRGRQAAESVTVGGNEVKALPYHENTKYLGRKFTFDDQHTTQITNRIAIAWRKFNVLRNELTSQRYSVCSRLHLFQSTVSPTIFDGCTNWKTTKALTTKLQTTQRRMLRLMIKTTCRSNTNDHDGDDDTTTPEDWPAYIKRASATVENHLHRLQIETWTTTYFVRKRRWAARIAKKSTIR